MATFQSVVLVTAIIILIILLIFIAIILYYQKFSSPWPPQVPMCPDYWVAVPGTVDSVSQLENLDDIQFNYNDISGGAFDASGAVCVNVKKLGSCPASKGNYLVKDFTGTNFEGAGGACKKYQWAKGCGVSWDGITYGTAYTPCDASYNDPMATTAPTPVGGKCFLSSYTFSSLGSNIGNSGYNAVHSLI